MPDACNKKGRCWYWNTFNGDGDEFDRLIVHFFDFTTRCG